MKVKPGKRTDEVVLELGRRDEPLLTAAGAAAFAIKRILVPLDFSECSKKALRYALALARQHSAALVLLYVAGTTPAYGPLDYAPVDFGNVQQEMEAGAAKQLAKMIEDEIGDAVPAEAIIRAGMASTEIVEAARELTADLIVISTHGRSGLKHVLLGSVAEQVVRHAPCPVLVVREREHEFLRG